MDSSFYNHSTIDGFIDDFNLFLDNYNSIGVGNDKSYSLV
jgi:hypothetical protein